MGSSAIGEAPIAAVPVVVAPPVVLTMDTELAGGMSSLGMGGL